MPSKPAKYGLKIFWVCDARIPYAIDGIVYTGRQPGEEVQKNLGENIVQQLCSRFRNTGRNITMITFSPVCLLRSISWRRIPLLWGLYVRTSQTSLL